MAFGGWLKKIAEKAKTIGRNVIDTVKRYAPKIKQGLNILGGAGAQMMQRAGEDFNIPALRQAGEGMERFAGNANRYISAGERVLNNT